jgi:hypothetical protein
MAHKCNCPVDVAKGDEVLAQHAHSIGDVLKIPRKADWVPIMPQHLAGQAIGRRARILGHELVVAVRGLKRWHGLYLVVFYRLL